MIFHWFDRSFIQQMPPGPSLYPRHSAGFRQRAGKPDSTQVCTHRAGGSSEGASVNDSADLYHRPGGTGASAVTHPHPDALGEAAEKPPNRTESCFTSSTGDCHPSLPFPWPRATCLFLSLLPASPRATRQNSPFRG